MSFQISGKQTAEMREYEGHRVIQCEFKVPVSSGLNRAMVRISGGYSD